MKRQDEMRREVQTMRMMSHPNLVDILCCFVSQQELWLVMRYLAGGSALNLLKWEHQKGFDEPTIATIAKSVLQALAYCHKNQLIHRDIKSGNILLDTDGSVRNNPPSLFASRTHRRDSASYRAAL
jgi:serine/threonine-protein kinase OSR1/STK39